MKKLLCMLISVIMIISTSIALADKGGNGKSDDSKGKTHQESSTGKNSGGENNAGINSSNKNNSDSSSQGEDNKKKDKDAKLDENKKVGEESSTEENIQPKNNIGSLNQQLKENFKDKAKRKEIIQKIKELKKESKLIFLNGEEVVSDTPPVIKYGRTLLPVRAITNALGATVSWNAETHTATITKDETVVVIEMGNKTVMVNGNPVELDVPAEIINNRTMVPLRFLAQVFKKNVEYDDGTVIIGDDDNGGQTPQPSGTPTPTPIPGTTPDATPEATPTPTPSPEATATPTPIPTATQIPEPTSTPIPQG